MGEDVNLAFFTIRAFRTYKQSTLKAAVISFLFVLIYAILDETHQLFKDGRTPLKSDVIVDCFGGGLGIVFYLVWKRGRSYVNFNEKKAA
ncbi:VanZ family protein [Niallia sp. 01092]|uniref:VanZ family protein n=1 Tax=unclassified Niallia TaxID=2837522 RepID=UPI003FD36018